METRQDHAVEVQEIQKKIEEMRSKISKLEGGQDIVAFIGPTKSGKSTLINSLLRKPLKKKIDADTEEVTLVTSVEGEGLIIDNTESFIQQCNNCPDTTYPMVDFPGFGYMAGAPMEISSAVIYEEFLRSQRSVRFVLVVPIEMIKNDNPMDFFKLLNNLVTLCPKLHGSFCIVATKSDSTSITTYLKKAMTLEFSSDNKNTANIVDVAKSAIKHILQSMNCIDFKAPNKEGRGNFILRNIKEIVALIKELKGVKIETQVPVSISDYSIEYIVNLYRAIELQLEEKKNNITQYLELGNGDWDNTSNFEKLAKILDNYNQPSDFKSFIKVLTNSGYDNCPLVENINELIYVQSIMIKFHIEGYMDKKDEEDFVNAIGTEIKLVAVKCGSHENKADVLPAKETVTEHEMKLVAEKCSSHESKADVLPAKETVTEPEMKLVAEKCSSHESKKDDLSAEEMVTEPEMKLGTEKCCSHESKVDVLPANEIVTVPEMKLVAEKCSNNESKVDVLPVNEIVTEPEIKLVAEKCSNHESKEDVLSTKKIVTESEIKLVAEKCSSHESKEDVLSTKKIVTESEIKQGVNNNSVQMKELNVDPTRKMTVKSDHH